MSPPRLDEARGRVDLVELALDRAVAGGEAPAPAGADVHLLDGRVVAPPLRDQLRVGPDAEDVVARRVELALDADLELARRRHLRLHSLTACLTRSAIFFSSAFVSFVSAYDVGHIEPSSMFALSWKPNVA